MQALAAAVPLLAVLVALLFGRSSRTAALAGVAVLVPLIVFLFPTPWGDIAQAGLDW
ncbi:hypothetical protein [Leucobacter sp. G161]|uniref:hypothetical protein n=1 Tax=Leucobacter sp. G161 TaxID=663704 RepID=UPI000ABE1BB5|nr:hypothetical protein [Leucobacter sp. G161]